MFKFQVFLVYNYAQKKKVYGSNNKKCLIGTKVHMRVKNIKNMQSNN